jgi:hypothetical protein
VHVNSLQACVTMMTSVIRQRGAPQQCLLQLDHQWLLAAAAGKGAPEGGEGRGGEGVQDRQGGRQGGAGDAAAVCPALLRTSPPGPAWPDSDACSPG